MAQNQKTAHWKGFKSYSHLSKNRQNVQNSDSIYYRVNHLELTQSKDLAGPDVLTNLLETNAQWLPEWWKFMPDPLFKTFLTSRSPNGLCQKGCHILVKNWIFDDPFHKKETIIGHVGDQTIRISIIVMK